LSYSPTRFEKIFDSAVREKNDTAYGEVSNRGQCDQIFTYLSNSFINWFLHQNPSFRLFDYWTFPIRLFFYYYFYMKWFFKFEFRISWSRMYPKLIIFVLLILYCAIAEGRIFSSRRIKRQTGLIYKNWHRLEWSETKETIRIKRAQMKRSNKTIWMKRYNGTKPNSGFSCQY
jgi:uncharacterized membrane protein YbhN (UPF0104 family)